MFQRKHRILLGLAILAAAWAMTGRALAAKPTVEAALTLKPLQADVDYETPTGDDVAKCTIQTATGPGASGWLVFNSAGQLLQGLARLADPHIHAEVV